MHYQKEARFDFTSSIEVVDYKSGSCTVTLPSCLDVKLAECDLSAHNEPVVYLPLVNPCCALHCLLSLPRHDLVHTIRFEPERSPEDAVLQIYYRPDFRAASGHEQSTIILYGNNSADFKVEHLLHEWSHLVQASVPLGRYLFNLASEIERGTYYFSDFAGYSQDEDWAVSLGEAVLNSDADFFYAFALQAPLRVASLGIALAAILAEDARTADGAFALWGSRCEAIRRVVVPHAQERLGILIASNGPMAEAAAKLLLHMGGDMQIATTKIKSLSFIGEPLEDKHLLKLCNIVGLKELNLSGTLITDAGLKLLDRLGGLEVLNLSGTQVTSSCLETVQNLKSLQVLDLSDTLVNDRSIYYLGMMKQLKQLLLPASHLSPEGYKRLVALLSGSRVSCQ